MIKKEFKIFIDFDGTITQQDVGDAIFMELGDKNIVGDVIPDLLADKISAKECWSRLCNSVENVSESKLNNLIDGIKVDPYFHSFIEFCRENNLEHYILSDGFDYYISRILNRENLDGIKFYSNSLKIENNKLVPSFPYSDVDFPVSANCKRNHIINHSSDDEFTVFIGDGNSDKYTIEFCDFIFAKDSLLKYCEKHRISYYPFDDFNDVTFIMKKLLSKKRLRKRNTAVLKRREAYMVE
jgi:2-hydroxy-3-keto-5-methylthiopentenyl-1-phosphate phosphatase